MPSCTTSAGARSRSSPRSAPGSPASCTTSSPTTSASWCSRPARPRQVLDADPERVREPLLTIEATGRQAIGEMRRLLGHPARRTRTTRRAPPQPGLGRPRRARRREPRRRRRRRRRGQRRAGARSRPGVDLAAYRIVQEALTNVRKHAGDGAAARVAVHFGESDVDARGHRRRPRRRPRAATATPATGSSACASARRSTAATLEAEPRPDGGFRVARPAPGRRGAARVIRVLVADDQALVRGGVRMIVEAQPDMEVAGEAADGAEAVELARRTRPDVVLMDIRMPGRRRHRGRPPAARATRRSTPRCSSSRRSTRTSSSTRRCARAPAGFLLKSAPPEQLVPAIRTVAAGEALLAPGDHPPDDRGVRPAPAPGRRARRAAARAHRARGRGARAHRPRAHRTPRSPRTSSSATAP